MRRKTIGWNALSARGKRWVRGAIEGWMEDNFESVPVEQWQDRLIELLTDWARQGLKFRRDQITDLQEWVADCQDTYLAVNDVAVDHAPGGGDPASPDDDAAIHYRVEVTFPALREDRRKRGLVPDAIDVGNEEELHDLALELGWQAVDINRMRGDLQFAIDEKKEWRDQVRARNARNAKERAAKKRNLSRAASDVHQLQHLHDVLSKEIEELEELFQEEPLRSVRVEVSNPNALEIGLWMNFQGEEGGFAEAERAARLFSIPVGGLIWRPPESVVLDLMVAGAVGRYVVTALGRAAARSLARQAAANALRQKAVTRAHAFAYSKQQGLLGEEAARRTMARAGYTELPGKLARDRGFDGVFVKEAAVGSVADIIIVESKYRTSGYAALDRSAKGTQLSPEWIEVTIAQMERSADRAVVATAELLRTNRAAIRIKANALDFRGVNRWNRITLPKPE